MALPAAGAVNQVARQLQRTAAAVNDNQGDSSDRQKGLESADFIFGTASYNNDGARAPLSFPDFRNFAEKMRLSVSF